MGFWVSTTERRAHEEESRGPSVVLRLLFFPVLFRDVDDIMSCCKGISREEQLNMKDSTWRKTTQSSAWPPPPPSSRSQREREESGEDEEGGWREKSLLLLTLLYLFSLLYMRAGLSFPLSVRTFFIPLT
jgi:hypothetical protein